MGGGRGLLACPGYAHHGITAGFEPGSPACCDSMNPATSPTRRASRPLQQAVVALVVAYPVLLLVVDGWVNTLFGLLLILSPFVLWQVDAPGAQPQLDRRGVWAYALAMASLPLAVLLAEWASQRWAWRFYDAPSRFLFAVPVFLALRRIPRRRLRLIGLGFAAGAIAALLDVLLDPNHSFGPHRVGTSFLNPIHFGDLSLSLGLLAALSIDWGTRDPAWARGLKGLALCAGLSASVLSGSRGGWVALPVLGLGWLWLRRGQIAPARLWLSGFGAVVAGVGAYLLVPEIHHRIGLILVDLVDFRHGMDNTSVGIRFQLWRVAWMLFEQHPLFGIGPGGFKAVMPQMLQAGQLTALAADFGRQEVHSEIMSKLSQMGVSGFVALMSAYFVPFALFARGLRSDDATRRRAAEMGLALVLCFAVYGLTVEIFILSMTAAFFTLTTAVLLGIAWNDSRE